MTGDFYMGSYCKSNIRSSPDLANRSYWIMGAPFYQRFEIKHDAREFKVGFKKRSTSDVSSVTNSLIGASYLSTSMIGMSLLSLL